MDKASSHFVVLDGIRGIAAISVMLYHFTVFGHTQLFKSGILAVDLFFMLSGFVIAHAYGNRVVLGAITFREFMTKRLVRLYPMFFASLCVGLPVLWLLSKAGKSTHSLSDIAVGGCLNLLFLPYLNGKFIQDFQGAYAVQGSVYPSNDPAWSLFFELIGSVCFSWLVRLGRMALLRVSLLSFAAILLYGVHVHLKELHTLGISVNVGWATENFLGGLPRVLYGFACGILLYKVFMTPDVQRRIKEMLPGSLRRSEVLYAATLLILLFPFGARGTYCVVALLILCPALIFAGALIAPGNRMAQRLASGLGWISYPLYCIHFPVGRATFLICARFGIAPNESWVPIALSSLASLLCAYLISVCWETPVRNILAARTRPR